MNVIVVMNDSLRRDHIAAYGVAAPWTRPGHEGEPFVHTPNMDRLFAESAVFDRCYIASYPTVPNRRDLYTGRWGFVETGWEPLLRTDVLLAEVLSAAGAVTQLFFDTLPMGGSGYGFERGFQGWEWVRGQHGDQLVTAPYPVEIGCLPHQMRGDRAKMERILRNTYARRYERDHMAPKTCSAAVDWLEDNYRHDQFLLWVDTWDPHEPFDAPAYDYARYADPAYRGPEIIYPQYGRCSYLSPSELNDIRARYAAEVTMVDRGLGQLLAKVDALGLSRNTMIVHITDHGYLLGEHDLIGKPGDLLGNLYEPTCHVGMMIRHPQGLGGGQRIGALVQPPDVMPTILEFMGIEAPPSVQGRSLLSAMRDPSAGLRDAAISARFIHEPIVGAEDTSYEFDGMAGAPSQVCARTVTTDRWSYLCAPYDMRSELYDLAADPDQTVDVIDEYPQVADELRATLIRFLEERGAAEPGIAPFRRPLGAKGGTTHA